LINREQTGFINYQELKKFLIEAGLSLSMHDLMAVLKRLDRSRNGVIVEH
jgi:Ca2+-binding EF-hand superfamily protein